VSLIAERKDSELKSSATQLIPNCLVLRCMVFKNDQNEYTAECVDLNLLVYGKTPHSALDSLRGAMVGYLAVAFAGDPTGLVPRPSPFSHRAKYHFYALRAALSAGAKRNFLVSDWSPNLCKAH
jgi:hypothetical protein